MKTGVWLHRAVPLGLLAREPAHHVFFPVALGSTSFFVFLNPLSSAFPSPFQPESTRGAIRKLSAFRVGPTGTRPAAARKAQTGVAGLAAPEAAAAHGGEIVFRAARCSLWFPPPPTQKYEEARTCGLLLVYGVGRPPPWGIRLLERPVSFFFFGGGGFRGASQLWRGAAVHFWSPKRRAPSEKDREPRAVVDTFGEESGLWLVFLDRPWFVVWCNYCGSQPSA